jgi:hypothetical protein
MRTETKGKDLKAALRRERLKERINKAEYRVDVDAVADAIVRRMLITPPESGAGSPPRRPRGHHA